MSERQVCSMKERIVFLGTPQISAYVLEGLVKGGMNIVGVVTKEDKVRARNGKIEEAPVALKAKELNLPYHKPHRLNQDFEILKEWNPDLLLTFSYGQIISDEVLSLSKFKPLNLHGSLLPKYRGASPMQAALRNGDSFTGVSLMEMVHEMDAGDVYATKEIPLSIEDNYTSLCQKMAEAALALALDKLPLYFKSELSPIPQDKNLVTFTHMISKEEEHLSLDSSVRDFVNQVRSLSETPGAYVYNRTEILKIYKAMPYSDSVNRQVGTLRTEGKKILTLQLKDGEVRLFELQRPGKKKMSAIDFINGAKNLSEMTLK